MENVPTVDKKQGFRVHAFVFVAVMVVLAAINLVTGGYLWVLWVLLAWGVGLFAHWFFVLGPGKPSGAA